jgi:hypothetical protein
VSSCSNRTSTVLLEIQGNGMGWWICASNLQICQILQRIGVNVRFGG